MTQRRHLDDLFSAAYEDELSPIDDARFRTHIQSCEPCAEAYAEFRATVETLHKLPRASMPRMVVLPSTPPVAEIAPRIRTRPSWFSLEVLRRFPATAAAGAIAVVLVIVALTRGAGQPTPTTTHDALGSSSGGAIAPVTTPAPVADASCLSQIVGIPGVAPPADFAQQNLAADPTQPALRLLLATPSLTVAPGGSVLVYAQLSVPTTAIANPGTSATPPPPRAVRPCVSIVVGNQTAFLQPVPAGVPGTQFAPGQTPFPVDLTPGGASAPLLVFKVPSGLAAGTVLHVVATVPAGYAGVGTPALRATLTLTTR